eukprot:scaffold132180_cov36-Phaeocystis_antarctica.AAC.1
MPPRDSQKLFVILRPRDEPLPDILCWPGSIGIVHGHGDARLRARATPAQGRKMRLCGWD